MPAASRQAFFSALGREKKVLQRRVGRLEQRSLDAMTVNDKEANLTTGTIDLLSHGFAIGFPAGTGGSEVDGRYLLH